MSRLFLVLSFVVVSLGCSSPTSNGTDASRDLGADTADMSWDAASPDLATDLDGGTEDFADGSLGAFGEISGTCGVLDDELTSPDSTLFRNAIDFGNDPYDDSDAERLTEGGREIIADGNAGGNSLLSEVFAYEVLARCEGAVLLKTETEVEYVDPMGKITDLLVELDDHRIGVSVTRAVGFPRDDPYTVDQASMLLEDKLNDVALSSENVAASDRWTKQILHVVAYAPGHAESIQSAYDSLESSVTRDTVVWVTVSDGEDGFLYE